uniref:Reverse transcriptase domain-containing protein n=1 Tax=Strongyloides papillosus TaxID=174720 RepID=A0A0N5BG19_STREA
MAPPDYKKFSSLEAFLKVAKARIQSLTEEEKKLEYVETSIPKDMLEKFCHALSEEDSDLEYSAESILTFVEELIKDGKDKEPLIYRCKDLFAIRLDANKDSANMDLLSRLVIGYRGILKTEKLALVQKLAMMRYLDLLPDRATDDFNRWVSNKIEPTYEEVVEFASNRDITFKRHKKTLMYKEKKMGEERGPFKKIAHNDEKAVKTITKSDHQKKENKKSTGVVEIVSMGNWCEKEDELPYATVVLNGNLVVKALLDSGASTNLIPKKLVEMLKDRGAVGELKVVNGRIKDVSGGMTDIYEEVELMMDIPGANVKEVSIIFKVMDCETAIIGRQFLREHKINAVDYEERIFGGLKIDISDIDVCGVLHDHPFLYKDKGVQKRKLEAFFSVKDMKPKRIIRRIKQSDREEVVQEIERQKSYGWLREAEDGENIENLNPLVIARKRSGKIRITQDLRYLNQFVSLDDETNIPSISTVMDIETDMLSFFDIRDAYHNCQIREDLQKWFAFEFEGKILISTVLPQGFKLSPYIWINAMHFITKPIEKYLIIYYDDVVNVAPSNIHHKINKKFLEILANYNIPISAEKCKLGTKRGIFLGYLLEAPIKISVPLERIQTLLNLKCPSTGKEIQETLGKIQYFARGVLGIAEKCNEFNKRRNDKNVNKKDLEEAWKSLMRSVAETISLRGIRNDCKELEIYIFCTGETINSTLKAKYENQPSEVVAVSGRRLKSYEQRYGKAEKILLAAKQILFANQILCCRFPIKIFSTVRGIEKAVNVEFGVANNTFSRLNTEISSFDKTFQYLKESLIKKEVLGEENFDEQVLEKEMEFVNTINYNERNNDLDKEELIRATALDNDALILKSYLDNKNLPQSKRMELPAHIRGKLEKMKKEHGCIFIEEKLFIPLELQGKLIQRLHQNHKSLFQIKKELNALYIGRGLLAKAESMVKNCEVCNRLQRNRNKKVTEWIKAEMPRERYHSDVGHYENHKFLLTIDAYTTYTTIVKIKSENIKHFKEAFSYTYSKMDCPMIQVVDNHRTLISNELNEYFSGLHVKLIKSIPEQHESNGLAERFIGMAKELLHKNNDKPITEAITIVNNILNSRIIDGNAVKDSFFGYRKSEGILDKYEKEIKVIGQSCWFKKKLDEREWSKGFCMERIGSNTFIIEEDGTDRIFVRRGDAVKLHNHRQGIKIKDEIEVANIMKERNITTLISVDGSTEKGKGCAVVIYGYKLPVACSAQTCEIKSLYYLIEVREKNIEHVAKEEQVMLMTDSDYAFRTLIFYLDSWKLNGWKTTKGKEIANKKEWEKIAEHVQEFSYLICKVKAHAGILANEEADLVAKRSAIHGDIVESEIFEGFMSNQKGMSQ